MKRSRTLSFALSVVAILAVTAALVFHTKTSHASAPVRTPAPTVATVTVARTSIANSLTVAGEFQPWQEVELHAKVAGYIKKIGVDIGDRVRAGQTLAVLEVPELNAQVEGAAAGVRHSSDEIHRAQNEVTRAEAAHTAPHAAYERLNQVSRARPGLIAEQELDDAYAKDRTSDAQVEVAKSGLSAALQQLQVSKAAHQQVTAMQDYSRIVAPFDGVVTWRYADTGALIQAGTSNASAMPVVKVAEVKVLRLRIPVPESIVAGVRVGDEARVTVQATGEKFRAEVARFTNSLDRTTRTMQVEIDIVNPNYELSPGMYAYVNLQVQNCQNVLTVPVAAVQHNAGKTSVVLVDSSNRVELRNIVTGVESPGRVEVVAGLQDGDKVVVGNLGVYQNGEVVVPKPSTIIGTERGEGGEQ